MAMFFERDDDDDIDYSDYNTLDDYDEEVAAAKARINKRIEYLSRELYKLNEQRKVFNLYQFYMRKIPKYILLKMRDDNIQEKEDKLINQLEIAHENLETCIW